MTATMPPAWTQLRLDQLAAEHHAVADPRHRGRFAIETPAGTLRLTALVRDAGTTWLELDRSECDPLPASAQDWLDAHVLPYLVRHVADGGPGGLGPAAGRTSGIVPVPTYDAAAALAGWLARELAWQTHRPDPCTHPGCASPARGLTLRHVLDGAPLGEHDCQQCAPHCELERYVRDHRPYAAASSPGGHSPATGVGQARHGPPTGASRSRTSDRLSDREPAS